MPKATVHKYGKPLTPENEVWFAGQRLVSAPACDATGAKDSR
jgi:hypothetical protein